MIIKIIIIILIIIIIIIIIVIIIIYSIFLICRERKDFFFYPVSALESVSDYEMYCWREKTGAVPWLALYDIALFCIALFCVSKLSYVPFLILPYRPLFYLMFPCSVIIYCTVG